VKWVRENPKTPLPRSVSRICQLTGCTEDQVKTFLYRRRKLVKSQIKQLPELRGKVMHLKATDGSIVDMRFVLNYQFVVDHWTAKVQLVMTTELGEFTADIPNLQDFVRQVHSSI